MYCADMNGRSGEHREQCSGNRLKSRGMKLVCHFASAATAKSWPWLALINKSKSLSIIEKPVIKAYFAVFDIFSVCRRPKNKPASNRRRPLIMSSVYCRLERARAAQCENSLAISHQAAVGARRSYHRRHVLRHPSAAKAIRRYSGCQPCSKTVSMKREAMSVSSWPKTLTYRPVTKEIIDDMSRHERLKKCPAVVW